MIPGLIIALVLLAAIAMAGIRIVKEYERGVIFRLGRVVGAKGPGLFFIIPIVDKMQKVTLQTVTMDIPPQDIITKDNVTVRVNAVTYFNVTDPERAVINVENYLFATSQVAQTTLRSILGQVELDELLINRDEINDRLQTIIDELTDPWGVKVTLVEVKDVELPDSMRRAMARQAESERERRAKVIHAEGEFEAAKRLSEAADQLAGSPGAMQLRVLSTMSEISAERNSTLIFPLPMELLRFMEAGAEAFGGGDGDRPAPTGPTGPDGDRPRVDLRSDPPEPPEAADPGEHGDTDPDAPDETDTGEPAPSGDEASPAP